MMVVVSGAEVVAENLINITLNPRWMEAQITNQIFSYYARDAITNGMMSKAEIYVSENGSRRHHTACFVMFYFWQELK